MKGQRHLQAMEVDPRIAASEKMCRSYVNEKKNYSHSPFYIEVGNER